MAWMLGSVIGGGILLYLLSHLFEWAIFQRFLDDPKKGALASLAAAYIVAVIVYGFGSADGGPWNPAGFIGYGFGLILALPLRLWDAARTQRKIDAAAGDTFQ